MELSTALVAPESDTAPDGDGRTAFSNVTLTGRTAAGATVTLLPAGPSTTPDVTGSWRLPSVDLALGTNAFSLAFSDGTTTFTVPLGVQRLAPSEDGDAVLDWNAEALDVLRQERQFPPPSTRVLAMVHVAVHDAVASVVGGSETYLGPLEGAGGASPSAAAAAAAHRVLTLQFPARKSALDARLALSLHDEPAGPARDAGVALGVASADRIRAARAGDGSTAVSDYAPQLGVPGRWQPTRPAFRPALLPQWANVSPFVLPSPDAFRPPGPPALGSARYAEHWDEVRLLGEYFSPLRTTDETESTLFWSDNSGSATPPGHWNRIAATVALERGESLPGNARLLALLNLALADAAISNWNAKYHFDFWRPVTAISVADTDGNDATAPDELWAPFLTTPPFPEYPSGHSSFSGAAAEVLSRWFGEEVPFTDSSDNLPLQFGVPDVTRSFPSFRAAAREASRSRTLGGIHFRFACEDGVLHGEAIGAWTMENALRPLPAEVGWMAY